MADRALLPTILEVVIGIIEVAILSVVAGMFGVAVDTATMPINWRIVFYSLSFSPILCFATAFANWASMFKY